MGATSVVLTIAGAWGLFFVILKYLEVEHIRFLTCHIRRTLIEGAHVRGVQMNYQRPLYDFMNRHQIEISLGHVKYQTSYFNEAIVKLVHGSRTKQKLFSLWYGLGACVGILLMAAAVLLLCYNFYSLFILQENEQPIMTPLVPGVNIPTAQIPYLFITLFLSALIHELGHAMAAANLGKEFSSIGTFVFIIFPGAFVSFVDEFQNLTHFNRLKIYCAGTWHNLLLVMLALLLSFSMPLIMSPLYSYEEGAVVAVVDQASPIASHLATGDIITGLNSCDVRSTGDWEICLIELLQSNRSRDGYCVPRMALNMATDRDTSCCRPGYTGALQCFMPLDEDSKHQEFCMAAKPVVSQPSCQEGNECGSQDTQCLIHKETTGERLMKIRKDHEGSHLIFLGTPAELYSYILTVNYAPKWTFLAYIDVHRHVEMILFFLISISSALAILNMAPVFYLDGQYACASLFALCFPHIPMHQRETAVSVILWGGSVFFACNVLLSFAMILI